MKFIAALMLIGAITGGCVYYLLGTYLFEISPFITIPAGIICGAISPFGA